MPQTGQVTQRDPIGIAGGLNQYGFAAGDPINNSDPSGLKVCFNGNSAQVDSMKTATEEATDTSIELDGRNCVTKVTANSSSGLTELGRRFAAMAGALDEEWNVELWGTFMGKQPGGYAYGTPKWGYAMLGQYNETKFHTGPWGECDGGQQTAGMAGMLAHELLGHLWGIREGGDLMDDTHAVASENLYRSMDGKGPQRCRY